MHLAAECWLFGNAGMKLKKGKFPFFLRIKALRLKLKPLNAETRVGGGGIWRITRDGGVEKATISGPRPSANLAGG